MPVPMRDRGHDQDGEDARRQGKRGEGCWLQCQQAWATVQARTGAFADGDFCSATIETTGFCRQPCLHREIPLSLVQRILEHEKVANKYIPTG